MNPLKKLAGQTAIYGIPGILGRILGYLLVILYSRVFIPDEYGTVSVFYAFASLMMIVLTYGMETAFFRFNENESDKQSVFSTGSLTLIISSLFFLVTGILFSGDIARWIDYPDHPEYVVWFIWILVLDALSAIPFARLRALNRPLRFAGIKMTAIILNIGLNLIFLLLCPFILKNSSPAIVTRFVSFIYNPEIGIGYIFISNLVSSSFALLLLVPQFRGIRMKIDKVLLRKMLFYAMPLLFAGLAGIINETFDRLLLRYLLPQDIASYQVGIYSACYKISILMTIFIQAYKYAAEPFFFAQAKQKDATLVYARIMDFFIIAVCLIFLITMLYLDDFVIKMIGSEYWEGKGVIPVLMMANLFLGIYYNLSIWYKLTSKTIWGAWLSIIGAVITLVLNFIWIPRGADHLIHGYIGSAWATLICYGSMMVLSYLIGQHYLPVKYNIKKFFGYVGIAVFLYILSILYIPESLTLRISYHTLLLCLFIVVVFRTEKLRISDLSGLKFE